MKIILAILLWIFKTVFVTPVGSVKNLISTIKKIRGSKPKKKSEIQEFNFKIVTDLIFEIAVIVPAIYAIIAIIVEYIGKATTGNWTGGLASGMYNGALSASLSAAFVVLAALIVVIVWNVKKDGLKKAWKDGKEELLLRLRDFAFDLMFLPLVLAIILNGTMIAQYILWGVIIFGVVYVLTSGGGGGADIPMPVSTSGAKKKEKKAVVKDDGVKVFSNSAKFIEEYSYNYSTDVILSQQGLGTYNFVCKKKDFESGKVIIKLENGKRITKNDIGRR